MLSCCSHGQSTSSPGCWVAGFFQHSAFDPPSETISPKHDKKSSKDVGSKKSKKKKKKKKSKTTSSNLQETQTTADFDDPVFDLLCKSKADSPATPVDSVKHEGRGVAKMMVRSGLRCPCHYVRRHLCPLKLLADEFGFTQSAPQFEACEVGKHWSLLCTVVSCLFLVHVVVTAIGFQRRLIMSDRSRSRSPQVSWRYYWSKTVAADGQHNWWKTWFPATPQWIKNRLEADKMWSQASTTTAPPSSEAQSPAVSSESPKKRKRSRTP